MAELNVPKINTIEDKDYSYGVFDGAIHRFKDGVHEILNLDTLTFENNTEGAEASLNDVEEFQYDLLPDMVAFIMGIEDGSEEFIKKAAEVRNKFNFDVKDVISE